MREFGYVPDSLRIIIKAIHEHTLDRWLEPDLTCA